MKNFPYKIILASKSPRRQHLLRELGFDFEVLVKEVEEVYPDNIPKEEVPGYLSVLKAKAFDKELDKDHLVITADTIVLLEEQIIGKPKDYRDAQRILKLLSGKKHEVITGVTLHNKDKIQTFSVKTDVYFKHLSEEEIHYYLENFKPYDKAGAYGIQECLPAGVNPCSEEEIIFLKQLNKLELIENSKTLTQAGIGYIGVERINGSYFNVMGLPVKELYEELLRF